MVGALRGELIATVARRLHSRYETVRKPYEGCLLPPGSPGRAAGEPGADRYSGAQAPRGVSRCWNQVRGRSLRGTTGQASGENPGRGQTPREHPAQGGAKHAGRGEGLPRGSKPRSRRLIGSPGDSSAGVPFGSTTGGFIADGNIRDTSRKEKASKGQIPGALPA
jgi:hypothetical protein